MSLVHACDSFCFAADEQSWELADWEWDPVNCVAKRKTEGPEQAHAVGTSAPQMEDLGLPRLQEGAASGITLPDAGSSFQATVSSAGGQQGPPTSGAQDWSSLTPLLPAWQPDAGRAGMVPSHLDSFPGIPSMGMTGMVPGMDQPFFPHTQQQQQHPQHIPQPSSQPLPLPTPGACSHHAALAACALRPPNRKRSNSAAAGGVLAGATTDARQRQRRGPCPLHPPAALQPHQPPFPLQPPHLQHPPYMPMDLGGIGWGAHPMDAADKAAAAAMVAVSGMGHGLPGLYPTGLEGLVSISDPPPPDQSSNRMVCQVRNAAHGGAAGWWARRTCPARCSPRPPTLLLKKRGGAPEGDREARGALRLCARTCFLASTCLECAVVSAR